MAHFAHLGPSLNLVSVDAGRELLSVTALVLLMPPGLRFNVRATQIKMRSFVKCVPHTRTHAHTHRERVKKRALAKANRQTDRQTDRDLSRPNESNFLLLLILCGKKPYYV